MQDSYTLLLKIDRKLDRLLAVTQKQEVWVTAQEINKLTGWSPNTLRAKRASGTITYKESGGGGYLYLLQSISAQHLI